MVLKGQFLERPTLIPIEGGWVLEGLSHRGEERPGLLVLPPPSLEGGGMDHVVGAELAFAVSREGHPTLRFNYRGIGASQGSASSGVEALFTDALAALELAAENAPGLPPVVAAIGASDAVALRIARERPVSGLALINPSLVLPEDLARLPPTLRTAVVLAELDDSQDRGRWAAALDARAGQCTVVPQTHRAFHRHLPVVGKAVATLVVSSKG